MEPFKNSSFDFKYLGNLFLVYGRDGEGLCHVRDLGKTQSSFNHQHLFSKQSVSS